MLSALAALTFQRTKISKNLYRARKAMSVPLGSLPVKKDGIGEGAASLLATLTVRLGGPPFGS